MVPSGKGHSRSTEQSALIVLYIMLLWHWSFLLLQKRGLQEEPTGHLVVLAVSWKKKITLLVLVLMRKEPSLALPGGCQRDCSLPTSFSPKTLVKNIPDFDLLKEIYIYHFRQITGSLKAQFMYQIIPSEVGFTPSQGTVPYSYKAFRSETLQTFAQNWVCISGTSEHQKRQSLYWLYAGTDFSFCLCNCGKKVNCRLIFTGPDASTVSHWDWYKDTVAHPQTDAIYPQVLFFFKTNWPFSSLLLYYF